MTALLRSTAVALMAIAAAPSVVLADPATAEIVASFDTRPGNPSITPDGRIFMTVHPLAHPDTKMIEITATGQQNAYPNAEIASGEGSAFKAPLSVRTDDNGVAWIVDLGAREIWGWDTNINQEVARIAIPADVLLSTSFVQDFALDQKRNRIIIADMTQGDLQSAPVPAFVTVDLETGAAARIAESHPALMPEMEGGFALNPITIDPDYEWVYFGAMHGHTLYRVPAVAFDEGGDVAGQIMAYGPKPYSDGITVDGSGNVYVNDIEAHAIGVTTSDDYKIIANLPEGQSWPDGISFGGDGFVYATLNQLERSAALNGGTETGTGKFDLIRVPALADGTTGR
ncbi:hypothetical protein BWR17_19180 (plasmid) [Phaeobacter inhibens]|uniref:L-dopachrome tautomerase-related protein n=1 Tax=Phaeobacter inhibens TaxID=221822 RepID=UPI000971A76E|nr:L-dopachrome tautomerase-related protein [Phaeobacter inhibens]APX18015.1 hypothetical protein BWR17_19180 [Phaeobacter inhibens]